MMSPLNGKKPAGCPVFHYGNTKFTTPGLNEEVVWKIGTYTQLFAMIFCTQKTMRYKTSFP